jgi:tripartite-type tricarboxylate transporter receptor subunit TctC
MAKGRQHEEERMQNKQLRAVILACALAPCLAAAQEFPARTVRIVVPFPPAGVADILNLRVE